MPKVDIPAVITDSSQSNSPTDKYSGEGSHSDSGEEKVKDDFASKPKKEINPTRYGDWEKNGRCIDF